MPGRAPHEQGSNAHVVLEVDQGAASQQKPFIDQPQWMKQRFWLLPLARTYVERASSASATTYTLETQLCTPLMASLWDHRVQGRALFPAAGYMEMALASLHILLLDTYPGIVIGLKEASIIGPLLIPRQLSGKPVMLSCECDFISGALNIASHSDGVTSRHMACQGMLLLQKHVRYSGQISLSLLAESQLQQQETPQVKHNFGSTSRLSAPHSNDADGFVLHPSSLDAALHLGAVHQASMMSGRDTHSISLSVPTAIEALLPPESQACRVGTWSWASAYSNPSVTQGAGLNCSLISSDGAVAEIYGVKVRKVSHAYSRQSDSSGVDTQTTTALQMQQLEEARMLYEVSYAVMEPAEAVSAPQHSLRLAHRQSDVAIAATCTAFMQQVVPQLPLLISATGGATAGMGGLVRAVALEQQHIAFHTQDQPGSYEPASSFSDATTIHVEWKSSSAVNRHSACRESCMHGLRFKPRLLASSAALRDAGEAFQMVPQPRGALSSLSPVPVPATAKHLQTGLLYVRIRAVGINFR